MRSRIFDSGVIRVIVVALVVMASGIGATAAATPVPSAGAAGKAVVIMGDSFTANGFTVAGGPACPHGPASWPTQLGHVMGLSGTADFEDVSCSGASIDSGPGYTLAYEARKAAEAGAFGSRTKVVAIQLGLNDVWGTNSTRLWDVLLPCVFDVRDGCGPEAAQQGRMPDYRGVSGQRYADRIGAVVTYVRYYAPSARIVLVGYPQLFPAGQDSVCLGVLGLRYVQSRGGALVDYLDRIDAAQREAAAILRVDYFDTRAVTAGHDLCSAQPWLNGIADPRGDLVGMSFHPSARGDSMIAAALYRWILGR